jgi:hypothetical protein
MLSELRWMHVRIRADHLRRMSALGITGLLKTMPLNIPCCFDTRLDRGGRFAKAVIAQFFVIHPGDLDVNIYPVKQGTRDAFLVASNCRRGARTRFNGVTVIAAGTWVQCEPVRSEIKILLTYRLFISNAP